MAKTYKKELLLILFSYPISSVIDSILFIIGNVFGILHSYGINISIFEDTYSLLLVWISINLYAILNILIKSKKMNKA